MTIMSRKTGKTGTSSSSISSSGSRFVGRRLRPRLRTDIPCDENVHGTVADELCSGVDRSGWPRTHLDDLERIAENTDLASVDTLMKTNTIKAPNNKGKKYRNTTFIVWLMEGTNREL